MSNKKGSVIDNVFLLISALVLVLIIILGYYILSSVLAAFHASPVIDPTTLVQADNFASKYVSIFDYAFLFILIGLTLTSIIGASMTDTHPILFGVSLILLIVTIFAAMLIQYVYQEIATVGTISIYESQFTIIPYFMGHLPFYILGLSALIIVMTLAKRSQ